MIKYVFVFFCLLPFSGHAQTGPSFDCNKASTAAEFAICADSDLAQLDQYLSDAYRAARAQLDDDGKIELRQTQRNWITFRDSCDNVFCYGGAMRNRIDDLRLIASLPPLDVSSYISALAARVSDASEVTEETSITQEAVVKPSDQTSQSQQESDEPTQSEGKQNGWVFAGDPAGGGRTYWYENDDIIVSFGCVPSQSGTTLRLSILVGETLQALANPVARLEFRGTGNAFLFSPNIFPDGGTNDRMTTAFRASRDLETAGPEAQFVFRNDNEEYTIPASEMYRSFFTLQRLCSRDVAPKTQPSFSCFHFLQAGDNKICESPERSALDREIGDRYLAMTAKLGLGEQALAWEGYDAWQLDRLGCGNDMDCFNTKASAYLATLPDLPDQDDSPRSSSTLADLTMEQARAEAASHGIENASLLMVRGNTAYFSMGDYSPTDILAVHDIGPETPFPNNPQQNIEVVSELKATESDYVTFSLHHVRFGYPLPDSFQLSYYPQDNFSIFGAGYGGNARLAVKYQYRAPQTSWSRIVAEHETRTAERVAAAAAYQAELEVRRLSGRAREAQRAAAMQSAGLIYKAPSFWAQFRQPDPVQTVFEGARLNEASAAWEQVIGGFVAEYADQCDRYLPDDSPTFTQTQITEFKNIYGITLRSSSSTTAFRVHPRIAPVISQMLTRQPSAAEAQTALDMATALIDGQLSLRNAVNSFAGIGLSTRAFVRASGACDSAQMTQFTANVLANADGGPTLREAGIAVAGSATASDLPPEPGAFVALSDACIDSFGYSRGGNEFCNCFSTKTDDWISEQDRSAALTDFQQLKNRVSLGGVDAEAGLGRTWQRCINETSR